MTSHPMHQSFNPYVHEWKCRRCGCTFHLKEPWNQEQKRVLLCDRCFERKQSRIDWSKEGF